MTEPDRSTTNNTNTTANRHLTPPATSVECDTVMQSNAPTQIRVLHICPSSRELIPFVHRQIQSLESPEFLFQSFPLQSRTSLALLAQDHRAARAIIRTFRPAIIHAHFGSVTAAFAACLGGGRLLVTYRGSDLNPSPSDSWFRNTVAHLCSQFAAWRATRIVCVSRQLTERLWVGAQRTVVIPDATNLALFQPFDRAEARRRLGLPTEKTILLFNARDPIGKRLDLAEQAFAIVARQRPSSELVVLRGQVAPDEMPLYYNAADCLLVASNYEGSPNVVREAMACNLPVVSVAVGDVPERLEAVHNSFIVERSPAALAEAVLRVFASGARSDGRNHCAAFEQQSTAARIQDIYRDMSLADPGSVRVAHP